MSGDGTATARGRGRGLEARRPDLLRLGVWVAVAGGLSLRLLQYASDRSLWLDESLLALNLLRRSAAELTSTLDYAQVAPVGFLEAEKLGVHVLGASELSLRLLPLLSGLVSLPLFAVVARRTLRPAAAVVATVLVACSPAAIYYSSEVKQYSSDVAVMLALFALMLVLLEPATGSGVRTVAAVAGAFAIGFSTAAAFVAGAAAFVIFAELARRRDRAAVESAVAAAVWVAAAAALVLFTSSRAAAEEGRLTGGGESGFFPGGRTFAGHLRWAREGVSALWRDAGYPDGRPERYTHWGLAVLAALGLVSLLRRRPPVGTFVTMTIVLTAIASAVHRYPIFDRTVLFLMPVSVLLVVEGAALLLTFVGRPSMRYGFAAVLGAVVVVSPVVHAADGVVTPMKHEEVKSALEFVRASWHPGDALLVDRESTYALAYYLECSCLRGVSRKGGRSVWRFAVVRRPQGPDDVPLRSRPPSFVVGDLGAVNAAALAREATGSHGRRRVWVVYSHVGSSTREAAIEALLSQLDRLGRRARALHAVGANALLYEIRPPS